MKGLIELIAGGTADVAARLARSKISEESQIVKESMRDVLLVRISGRQVALPFPATSERIVLRRGGVTTEKKRAARLTRVSEVYNASIWQFSALFRGSDCTLARALSLFERPYDSAMFCLEGGHSIYVYTSQTVPE